MNLARAHKKHTNYLSSPTAAIQLSVIEISDEETSSSSSGSENHAFLDHADANSKSSVEEAPERISAAKTRAPQTKVLFLDGARGLAAMLVVVQHTGEFWPDLHLGSVAVDVFFVLSSFLLTWILMVKIMKLLAQGATFRTWLFVLSDYIQKRFLRVYPLFVATTLFLSMLKPKDQRLYFIMDHPAFDMWKVLTFSFEYRYHVLWTLPLEIAYYFFIPVFMLGILRMRRFWWIAVASMAVWIVHQGIYEFRTSHQPMKPHIPTFLTGSLAAVVFVKLDLWIKKTKFEFRWWHTLLLRMIEGVAIAMLMSVCFRGLLFHWVHENPAPPPAGFPYTSAFLATIIVIEMIQPSCVSTAFEWNVLRFWGKISFSIYLLHTFVIASPRVNHIHYYFDRFFARLILVQILATTSYCIIEYPSQLLAQKISRFLTDQEKRGSGVMATLTFMGLATRAKQKVMGTNYQQ